MTNNKYWLYLEKLRRSGACNMWEATPYLMNEFKLEKDEAIDILADWISNYNEDDYKEYYYFTFCLGEQHQHNGRYVKVYGDYSEAREKMRSKYGTDWAFQYSARQFEEYENYVNAEKLLEVIN